MHLISMLFAPAAAFVLSPADMDVEGMDQAQPETRIAARSIDVRVEEPVVVTPMPVRLVSWDGDFELMKTSRRLRIWRSHLAYSISVDAEGNATSCELTETFRRAYVSQRLCDVLMEFHTFEPAHDAEGMPVEGTYSSRLSYQEMRDRL